MTTTPPEAPSGPDQGPRATREEIRDLGRLRRSTTDRHVAGVAGGLARHLDIDPVLLRVAFVVLIFFGGAGLLLYGACWLLVPEDDESEPTVPLDERTRAFALVLAGGLALLAVLGDTIGVFGFPWPLAIIGAIVLVLLTRSRRRGRSTRPAMTQAGPQAVTPGVPPTMEHGGTAPAGYPTAPGYAGYTPPPPGTPYAAPRSPRKRGPLLFWFTMALVVLLLGVLGMVDVSGVDVPGSAYPALVVATCGVMLLLGAFYGRAGGLILVGLLATVAMAGATGADQWDDEELFRTPRTAAAVQDEYRVEAGEVRLDLTQVTDLQGLDGRVIRVGANVGRVAVLIPDEGLDVAVRADVHGPGQLQVFDTGRGGIDSTVTESHDGGIGVPEIMIEADIDVGEVSVRRESDLSRWDGFDDRFDERTNR